MKPYTTIEQHSDGLHYLQVQLHGVELEALATLLRGRSLLTCSVPKAHAGGPVWSVSLTFDGDLRLELTSSSTVVQGWSEYGTINIEALRGPFDQAICELQNWTFEDRLTVAKVEIACWRGDGLVVPAGIRLHFSSGSVLSVVAWDVPGAMRLTLPDEAAPLCWQFPIDEYFFEVVPVVPAPRERVVRESDF